MSSFTRLATDTAIVKRYVIVAGKGVGSTTTVVPELAITPPANIDYNTAQRVGTTHRPILESPYKFRMVLFEGVQDVEQGDIMTINSVDYPVRHVEDWTLIGAAQDRMIAILEWKVR